MGTNSRGQKLFGATVQFSSLSGNLGMFAGIAASLFFCVLAINRLPVISPSQFGHNEYWAFSSAFTMLMVAIAGFGDYANMREMIRRIVWPLMTIGFGVFLWGGLTSGLYKNLSQSMPSILFALCTAMSWTIIFMGLARQKWTFAD